jgi:hypothetical protein
LTSLLRIFKLEASYFLQRLKLEGIKLSTHERDAFILIDEEGQFVFLPVPVGLTILPLWTIWKQRLETEQIDEVYFYCI